MQVTSVPIAMHEVDGKRAAELSGGKPVSRQKKLAGHQIAFPGPGVFAMTFWLPPVATYGAAPASGDPMPCASRIDLSNATVQSMVVLMLFASTAQQFDHAVEQRRDDDKRAQAKAAGRQQEQANRARHAQLLRGEQPQPVPAAAAQSSAAVTVSQPVRSAAAAQAAAAERRLTIETDTPGGAVEPEAVHLPTSDVLRASAVGVAAAVQRLVEQAGPVASADTRNATV